MGMFNETINELFRKKDKWENNVQNNLQKEASRDVRSGQLMNASDSTPHPFNSSETINGASMLSVFNFGHIPKLRDKRPT